MKALDKEARYIIRQVKSKLKRHDQENETQGRVGLTSAAARQSEKTKMQDKVKSGDQGMLRHAVKDVRQVK